MAPPSATSTAVLKPLDGKRNLAGIKNYTAHWDRDSAQDSATHTDNRKEAYTDVVNGYYDGVFALSFFSGGGGRWCSVIGDGGPWDELMLAGVQALLSSTSTAGEPRCVPV